MEYLCILIKNPPGLKINFLITAMLTCIYRYTHFINKVCVVNLN